MSRPSDKPVFALIDCNNFFVSCERLFRPQLNKVPVAVLSNNDGCVIARSNEVKAMGIQMGDPYFKHKHILKAHKSEIFSANFPLYGDISDRVTAVLEGYAPNVEIYSIDEAFMQVNNLNITDYDVWAKQLSKDIERLVGIPVSVGVAPTKTLAKMAVERVKKGGDLGGGYSIAEDTRHHHKEAVNRREESLRWLDLGDVWGIGRRLAPKLKNMGLRSAYDFTRLNDEWVLNNMSITGLRTIRELRGNSCIPLDEFEDNNQQKNLSVTRMFGRKVRSLAELEAATASYASRAASRLRRKEQLAWSGSVFLRASLPNHTTRYISGNFTLHTPTSFTVDIIKQAHIALRNIYDPDFRYEKGGIILSSLLDESEQQMSLFGGPDQAKRMKNEISLMKALDDLSLRYGKQSVTYAAEGYGPRNWRSKQTQVGPAYTTQWDQIPSVKII